MRNFEIWCVPEGFESAHLKIYPVNYERKGTSAPTVSTRRVLT